jgi:hypothetical protein
VLTRCDVFARTPRSTAGHLHAKTTACADAWRETDSRHGEGQTPATAPPRWSRRAILLLLLRSLHTFPFSLLPTPFRRLRCPACGARGVRCRYLWGPSGAREEIRGWCDVFARTPRSTAGHLHAKTTACADAWREIDSRHGEGQTLATALPRWSRRAILLLLLRSLHTSRSRSPRPRFAELFWSLSVSMMFASWACSVFPLASWASPCCVSRSVAVRLRAVVRILLFRFVHVAVGFQPQRVFIFS